MFWSLQIRKVDFEAAVISAINKAFQTPLLLAAVFILISAFGDNYKILVFVWNTRKVTSPTHMQNVCYFGIHTYVSVQENKIGL
jgi:hypothetical protein